MACISHSRRTYRLEISLHQRQTSTIERVACAITALRPGRPVGFRRRGAVMIVNAYANAWPTLFPQHGRGSKHTRDRSGALAAGHRRTASRGFPSRLYRVRRLQTPSSGSRTQLSRVFVLEPLRGHHSDLPLGLQLDRASAAPRQSCDHLGGTAAGRQHARQAIRLRPPHGLQRCEWQFAPKSVISFVVCCLS